VDSGQAVRQKWRLLNATMNERSRRLWAGAEADAIGYGGVPAVARATGRGDQSTVRKGRDEVRAGARPDDVVVHLDELARQTASASTRASEKASAHPQRVR
jgi:hypothetical protein